MRALAVLVLCVAPLAHAQQVILPLDKGYPEDQYFFLTYNAESGVTLGSRPVGSDGASTEARWRIEAGPGGLGYTGFGYLHGVATPPNPFPDLTPYTHLSLRYDNVRPAAGAEQVAFRFELHERETERDAQGFSGTQVWVYETDAVLPTSPGWTELLIPLVAVGDVGPDGFAIPASGFQGDGVFDLDQIRHWAVLLVLDGVPTGTVVEGTTLFDALTAVSRPVAASPTPPEHRTALLPGRPNPFAATTTVAYSLERPAVVSLRVYDVVGREVAVLVDERQEAGPHRALLAGSDLAAGSYLCVLDVDGERFVQLVTRR